MNPIYQISPFVSKDINIFVVLMDDFPSLKERIALRLVPPTEDSYFTNLLKVI